MQRTAYLLVGDWGLAEDLVQVALVKTYLVFKRTRIEAVEAYTRKVMVRTATSWWRRRWRAEQPSEVMLERAVPDDTERWVEHDRLWRLILALPPRQRAVLVLRFYEDMTEAAVAQMLGVSVGTVKIHSARALATLRQRLAPERVPAAARGEFA